MRAGEPSSDVVDEIVAAWNRELPEIAGPPLELSKRIARLARLVDVVTVAELERLGLTKAEYEVLAQLRAAGEPYRSRPGELVHSLSLSSGGTTNVLHRLADAGYVAREPSAEDRRGADVRLTDEGVRIAEAAVRATNGAQAELLDRLPAGLRRALADQLRTALLTLDPSARSARPRFQLSD